MAYEGRTRSDAGLAGLFWKQLGPVCLTLSKSTSFTWQKWRCSLPKGEAWGRESLRVAADHYVSTHEAVYGP